MAAAPHFPPPDPDEGFTIEQAEHLLPSGVRFELHGGRIVMVSPAKLWHTEVEHRLKTLLRRRGKPAYAEVGIIIGPGETRVLDVAVFRAEPDIERSYFDPREINHAVEVVSPSSRNDDYVEKPNLYARLGIGEFWRVDRDTHGAVHVSMHQLVTDRQAYELTGTATLDELENQ